MASESGEAGEWGPESDERIRRSGVKWRGKSWKTIGGFCDEGGSGWDCGRGTSVYSGGIDRLDTDFCNVRGGDC